MAQPTVIQGPAVVSYNGYDYFTQGNVVIDYNYETWNPATAAFGKLGERLKTKMAQVSFTPAGMYTAATAAKYWPNNIANIGQSIFTAAALPVAVSPLTGNKVTFARGGIVRYPALQLSPLATMWKEMSILCLGDPALSMTNVAWIQAIAATAVPTTFDETKVLSPRYTATLGAVFAAAEPDDEGFSIEPVFETKSMTLANYGRVDEIITSLGMRAKFKPLSLTEAQIATLIKLQDAAAALPGDSIGTADDLVITGTGLSLTLKQMGAMDASLLYASGEWRQGEVAFVNKVKFTAGVAQPLFTFA